MSGDGRLIRRNTHAVAQPCGQSEPRTQNPARGGRGLSMPNGPHGPLSGSESANIGEANSAGPDAGDTALCVAPPSPGSGGGGVSDFLRFQATERAVCSVGRAWTAALSGLILGPELTLTRGSEPWAEAEKPALNTSMLV
eukprot:13519929-Alexandrium_andersonii.AAC.1